MQKNLFTEDDDTPRVGYEEAAEAFLALPKKRIHNSKPTYTKVYENYQDNEGNVFDDIGTWGRMNTVYCLLANYFVLDTNHGKIEDFGIIRSRRSEYKEEEYKYKDLTNLCSAWQTYKGQEFAVRQAEIIGSELLPIEERLFLHETLLEYLDEGYRIEQLNWWIESLLNLCLQGYSARLIVLALLLYRGEENEKN